MNLLLFSAADQINQNTITIRDERLTHLIKIHRAAAGDTVRVGEINGMVGEGVITEINNSAATLTVALTQGPPAKLPVRLVLALPRPKMLRRIVRSVAEFGVSHLHLINSYRVEKSYWQTPVLEPATLRGYLLQGLEQARDTQLPSVSCHPLFKPFVEDELPTLIGADNGLVFHPHQEAADISTALKHKQRDTVLVIGPEGGFIPYEIEHLQSAGCTITHLGPRILRVENAVSTVLGQFLTHNVKR